MLPPLLTAVGTREGNVFEGVCRTRSVIQGIGKRSGETDETIARHGLGWAAGAIWRPYD